MLEIDKLKNRAKTGKMSNFPGLYDSDLRRLRSDLLNPKFGNQKSALL